MATFNETFQDQDDDGGEEFTICQKMSKCFTFICSLETIMTSKSFLFVFPNESKGLYENFRFTTVYNSKILLTIFSGKLDDNLLRS